MWVYTWSLMSNQWKLYRGNVLLGIITHTDDDFPWHNGTFKATEAFSEVKDLFEQELILLEERSYDEWERLYDELSKPGIRLVSMDDNSVIDELLIHVQGDDVWWRH